MFSQNNNKCIQHGLSVRIGKNFHTLYTAAFGLGTAGLETCARICKARNARFTPDTELSKLVFSNKTLIDCQGWTFTLFNSTCFLAEAWDTHKVITGMDYTSQIGKVAVTGRPHCVSNLDSSEPLLQVNGSLISANLMCTFSKFQLVLVTHRWHCYTSYC